MCIQLANTVLSQVKKPETEVRKNVNTKHTQEEKLSPNGFYKTRTVPAATANTLVRVIPRSAPIPGKTPGRERPAAFEPDGLEPLAPEEPPVAPPVEPPVAPPEAFAVPVVCAPDEPAPPVLCEPDALAPPVDWVPDAAPEPVRTRPFAIVEVVWQFDDDGVVAAVDGVTVVPTVYETGVPLAV
jgi:hypothetical protein